METRTTMSAPATLAQAIHALWGADAGLSALLPAEAFLTGRVPPSQAMPYCRLELPGGGEQALSNVNQYRTAAVVFHVWSDGFDAGDAIAPQIRRVFANQAVNWTGGGCLRMKPEGPPRTRQTTDAEIKAWETVQRFTAVIFETRQDEGDEG